MTIILFLALHNATESVNFLFGVFVEIAIYDALMDVKPLKQSNWLHTIWDSPRYDVVFRVSSRSGARIWKPLPFARRHHDVTCPVRCIRIYGDWLTFVCRALYKQWCNIHAQHRCIGRPCRVISSSAHAFLGSSGIRQWQWMRDTKRWHVTIRHCNNSNEQAVGWLVALCVREREREREMLLKDRHSIAFTRFDDSSILAMEVYTCLYMCVHSWLVRTMRFHLNAPHLTSRQLITNLYGWSPH